ncbi:filamentous haemagglutinin family protein [Geotalea uraniireducens]|uniref:Filamentous hemagglutinin family outer membrane protein n=1 Tax=Geotalea uraniireducens (strain Rf4) TaxID=351605 RepID=A5G4R9_GEOUR|nr:filamentous haemagglutinin family protein [Geotalea uraniireducens]ABQ26787.1 filamentous hemagglutinin family outer membrane protein [Geotalea uraniireducens Rf4]
MVRRLIALVLVMETIVSPAVTLAGNLAGYYGKFALPQVAPTALPQVKPDATPVGIKGIAPDPTNPNKLIIQQNLPRAVVDWSSFNIGTDAWVHFDQQKNSSWAVLNRIHDKDPSQIYGKLTADGKVFLLNQNGILFGLGSQINVQSLTASSLNIKDDDFLNGILHFKAENYNGRTDNNGYDAVNNLPGAVSNHGSISAGNLGEAFLIGPNVENNGTIITPQGQAALVAGTDVELANDTSPDTTRSALFVRFNQDQNQNLREAVNLENGQILADNGVAGMYGGVVRQQGLIRSVTAFKRNGQIELFASDRVVTGEKSQTITPLPDSEADAKEKFNEQTPLQGGQITVSGLQVNDPQLPNVFHQGAVNVIEHHGTMEAPSGRITLNASNRVYLDNGSTTSVSGLWNDMDAKDRQLSVQFSSVVLKDEQQQKYGPLKGKTITIDTLTGSAIGDISGALYGLDRTARQRSTAGGKITINAASGDTIVREGATVAFAGGGFRYRAGSVESTKLVSGLTIYDISKAPGNITYDRVLGSTASSFSNATPVYVEGSNAGSLLVNARQVVLDGKLDGSVQRGLYQTKNAEPTNSQGNVKARGWVEPVGGTLTIGTSPGDDSNVKSKDLTLTSVAMKADTTMLDNTFTADTQLDHLHPSELSTNKLGTAGLSLLNIYTNGSFILEKDAGLELRPASYLNADGTKGTSGLSVVARRIEIDGDITVPGGNVTLKTMDNKTTFDSDNPDHPLVSKIYLADGSRISVAGERVDNYPANGAAGDMPRIAHTGGGVIDIKDKTDSGLGVTIREGAVVDVSGGYLIDQKGKVTGGNAGTLTLQGSTLVADGDLRGYALPGMKGGTISMHAGEVAVTPAADPDLQSLQRNLQSGDTTLPVDIQGKLTFAGNRLANTGFTNIELKSKDDLTILNGIDLAPSKTRLAMPTPGMAVDTAGTELTTRPADGELFPGGLALADYLGTTSLSLTANARFEGTRDDDAQGNMVNEPNPKAKLTVAPGATIETIAPNGMISLTAPNVVVHGTLNAPAGRITVTANEGDLEIKGKLLADGFAKPYLSTLAGKADTGYLPLSGGTISLDASKGDLNLSSGSLVSVAGIAPVKTFVTAVNGMRTSTLMAGAPGEVILAAVGDLRLDGKLIGSAGSKEGIKGGGLSITSRDSVNPLSLSADQIKGFTDDGFDAFTFTSLNGLNFTGFDVSKYSKGLSISRSLTLDAPKITGSGKDAVYFIAPWIRLIDSNPSTVPVTTGAAETATLNLTGDWLDVEGKIALDGFAATNLNAKHDLRLADSASGTVWNGSLAVPGDLTIKAERIYPMMHPFDAASPAQGMVSSDFTINVEGKFTTLAAPVVSTPVYSAGGSLTINAKKGIEHNGFIAAPLGTISLNNAPAYAATSRVYLAPGSTLTTAGTAPVAYGFVDADGVMRFMDKKSGLESKGTIVTAAPEKSITINGKEVIVREQATIDVSGGGSVYATTFMPGIEGTVNPITAKGILNNQKTRPDRYVIVPDNSVQLPGFTYTYTDVDGKVKSKPFCAVHLAAIRLSDGSYLNEGTYSLLPEQYAFLPGALILTDLGSTVMPGRQFVTTEGYPVAAGYETVVGTGISSPVFKGYAVRSAADVLREGNFTPGAYLTGDVATKPSATEFSGGDAGTITLLGGTTILNGTLKADAVAGSSGGVVDLSGKNVTVQADTVPLDKGFNFASPVPAGLAGTLQLAASTLGKGLKEVRLGSIDAANTANSTVTVTVKQGTTLEAETVTLTAKDAITIEKDAQVKAKITGTPASTADGGGTVNLVSQNKIVVEAGGQVQATDTVSLETKQVELQGDSPLVADNGKLILKGDKLSFVAEDYKSGSSATAFYLTDALWKRLTVASERNTHPFTDVTLKSSDITFYGDFTESATKALTIDAGRIAKTGGTGAVSLTAPVITLLNSGAKYTGAASAATGQLSLTATDSMTIGKGDGMLDGFSKVDLKSTNDMTLKGVGSLTTNGADLNMTTARLTAAPNVEWGTVTDANGALLAPTYQAANFKIDAGSGTFTLASSGAQAGQDTALGGAIHITAGSIESSGLIDLPAGRVKLEATGTGTDDGIKLRSGAAIRARGHDYKPNADGTTDSESAGRIELRSAGVMTLEKDAKIDVSAPGAGDAGTVAIIADKREADLSGELLGMSNGGKGGSLTLDTCQLATFSALNDKVAAGGFTEELNIRSRNGDVTVAADDRVKAHLFRVAADAGNVTVAGTVDASGNQGGTVALNAGKDLSLSGTIGAQATAANGTGGDVSLGTAGGVLNLAGGSIDVSGAGKGGSVSLRAPAAAFDSSRVNTSNLNVTVKGASSKTAEAVQVVNPQNAGTITSDDLTSWNTAIAALMESQTVSAGQFDLRPGIEVRSSGSLTLNTPWDLTFWRFGAAGQPGVLTLRAAGNLNINNSLTDSPTAKSALPGTNGGAASWGIRLVAGADLNAADPMAVKPDKGILTIADKQSVYSEKAPVSFASGGNTVIGTISASSMINNDLKYNIGTYGGTIQGNVEGDLVMNKSGVIQSATGDIAISVTRDFNLFEPGGLLGSIRTTGEQTTPAGNYWDYAGGGDISLTAGRDIKGGVAPAAWYYMNKVGIGTTAQYFLSASFKINGKNEPVRGLATMAGGTLEVISGGDFNSQAGTFGSGDLLLHTGGNLNGRFLTRQGNAELRSLGNFGTAQTTDSYGRLSTPVETVIEAFATKADVSAQGNVTLGSVVNPTVVINNGGNDYRWNLLYSSDSKVRLHAKNGDVAISGLTSGNYYSIFNALWKARILPPTLEIAAGRNINLGNNLALAPSAQGGLTLIAGGDIRGVNHGDTGNTKISMSDIDPETVYNAHTNTNPDAIPKESTFFDSHSHNTDPEWESERQQHPSPITITAGGDIKNLQLFLPKQAQISAGRDVRDIYLVGQNHSASDMTAIQAGRDIFFSSLSGSDNSSTGIELGGSGTLLVQAGHNIDLGTTRGLQTYGGAFNQNLGAKGSDLLIAAGFADVTGQFDSMKNTAVEIQQLKAQANFEKEHDNLEKFEELYAAADQRLADERTAVAAYYALNADPANDGGNINMTSSQISTNSGADDIYILAREAVNVGKSTINLDKKKKEENLKNTGIFTAKGGNINIYAGGDVNVNEARVMTFDGGDINVWSEKGSINAGRGSKAAISADPPKLVLKDGTGALDPEGKIPAEYMLVFSPPAVGSGIRTLSYTPGTQQGDVNLSATKGSIDAGEAGIAGGIVVVDTPNLVNAGNIAASVGSVVGATAADSGVSIGALAGAGGLADSGKMIEQTNSLGAGKDKTAASGNQAVEDFVAKWLDVKVISFDSSFDDADDKRDTENKQQ